MLGREMPWLVANSCVCACVPVLRWCQEWETSGTGTSAIEEVGGRAWPLPRLRLNCRDTRPWQGEVCPCEDAPQGRSSTAWLGQDWHRGHVARDKGTGVKGGGRKFEWVLVQQAHIPIPSSW